MSNLSVAVNSGQRLSFYQLFKAKNLRVEIPLIQRDYAQGRDQVQEVRQVFLQALYRYLEEGTPFRDLDFIYGRVVDNGSERGCFIPLDGQQRLTTLFLLHWYLAQLDRQADSFQAVLSDKGRSYFTYETRSSSREFCHALLHYRLDLKALDAEARSWKLSAAIKDQSWFYLSWQYDPTIQSMLTMLDAIHQQFKNSQGFFAKLIDPESPVVTFLFLNLEEFNLTDDLYIKMNSRGKPLTPFENFKAQLEKKIKTYAWQSDYRLTAFSQPVSGDTYFAYKMDMDWANVFWFNRCEQIGEDNFDADLMLFIRLHIANHLLLKNSKYDQELYRKLFDTGGRLRALSFAEYESLQALSQEWVKDLMLRLDLLVNSTGSSGAGIATYLDANPDYDEETIFKKVMTNESSFAEKVRFHAFYTALACGKCDQELLDWMRVVFNLTANTIVDGGEEYARALTAIDALAKKEGNILDLLIQGIDISGFSGAQIFEERIKAHLILKSEDWKEVILNLEEHSFFSGQIGFALQFAGVVDYFIKHNKVDWDQAEDTHYLNKFRGYATAAAAVFIEIEEDSGVLGYAWERAVLSKGCYLTSATSNRFNLLSTRLVKNNIKRDHSWHRLLRLPLSSTPDYEQWVERQSYVKAVFDDPDFDHTDLQNSLEKIALKDLPDVSMEWQHLFRIEPKLFSDCGQGFVMIDNDDVLLLHESQRNHNQSELYTKFLQYKLEHQKIDVSLFEEFSYQIVRSSYDWPYLRLSNAKVQDQSFTLRVFYFDKKYHLFFFPVEREVETVTYPKAVVACLNELGFMLYGDWQGYEIDRGLKNEHYLTWCDNYEQAAQLINRLGVRLRKSM